MSEQEKKEEIRIVVSGRYAIAVVVVALIVTFVVGLVSVILALQ